MVCGKFSVDYKLDAVSERYLQAVELRRTIASRMASMSLHKIAAWSRLLSSMSARSSSESVGG